MWKNTCLYRSCMADTQLITVGKPVKLMYPTVTGKSKESWVRSPSVTGCYLQTPRYHIQDVKKLETGGSLGHSSVHWPACWPDFVYDQLTGEASEQSFSGGAPNPQPTPPQPTPNPPLVGDLYSPLLSSECLQPLGPWVGPGWRLKLSQQSIHQSINYLLAYCVVHFTKRKIEKDEKEIKSDRRVHKT